MIASFTFIDLACEYDEQQ